MRCAQVEPHIEAFVDGSLDPLRARAIDAHVGTCARCAARSLSASRIARALAAEPQVRAPRGLADRVMNAVYRQALAGDFGAAQSVESRRLPARVYRRIGLSCMLTAGVLAVSLLIPRVAYSTLVGNGIAGAAFSRDSTVAVRSALDGANSAVRGILGERVKEGSGK